MKNYTPAILSSHYNRTKNKITHQDNYTRYNDIRVQNKTKQNTTTSLGKTEILKRYPAPN